MSYDAPTECTISNRVQTMAVAIPALLLIVLAGPVAWVWILRRDAARHCRRAAAAGGTEGKDDEGRDMDNKDEEDHVGKDKDDDDEGKDDEGKEKDDKDSKGGIGKDDEGKEKDDKDSKGG